MVVDPWEYPHVMPSGYTHEDNRMWSPYLSGINPGVNSMWIGGASVLL